MVRVRPATVALVQYSPLEQVSLEYRSQNQLVTLLDIVQLAENVHFVRYGV
jgi:hypothetical protein